VNRRATRPLVALFAAVLLVTAVSACTSSTSTGAGPSGTGSASSAGQPRAGGTLTYIWPVDTPDLNPDTGFGPSFATGSLERFAIYDALVTLSSTAQVQYRIAKSLTTTNNVTWKLVLNPGVKFSDGTPLDAAAVQYSWDHLNGARGKAAYAPIASTTVVNSTTLDITLKAANPLFPQYLAQQTLSFIGSPKAEQAEGPTKFGQDPVGAGPYELKSWVHNDEMVLARNPDFYGKTYLSQIDIKYIADSTQAYTTLTSGAGEVLFSSDYTIGATAQKAGYTVDYPTQGGGLALIFDVKQAPFSNLEARKAVAEALNGSALSSSLYAGAAQTVTTLFGSNSPFYYDAPQVSPNAQQAQTLFNQLAAAGKPVSFSIVVPDIPQLTAPAAWIQATLAGFKNVTVKLDDLAVAQAVQQASGHDFQAFVGPVWFVDPYPILSGYVTTGGVTNYGQYSNPAVDAAFKSGLTENMAARKAAYGTVQQQLVHDIPIYWLVRTANMQIYSSKAVGAVPVINGGLPDWSQIWLK
jgi:peptide/nickel transport system substrate-binding protein